jgi:hypothetical protein
MPKADALKVKLEDCFDTHMLSVKRGKLIDCMVDRQGGTHDGQRLNSADRPAQPAWVGCNERLNRTASVFMIGQQPLEQRQQLCISFNVQISPQMVSRPRLEK